MNITLLNTLQPTVLTAQGELSNVCFNEEDLITRIEPNEFIHKITCNYGVKVSDSFVEETKVKKSNRGRKKKDKKESKRKNQGSGKCFNSQITLWVCSDTVLFKYYKVKVFRNGKYGIPGGLIPDMSDVKRASICVSEILSKYLNSNVTVTDLYSTMRNYKTSLKDCNKKVNLPILYNLLLVKIEDKVEYMVNVTEVKYNPERYEGLTIKFSTPTEKDNKKKTTIKLFRSGKVNIDGAVSEKSAYDHYRWISDLYYEIQKQVIYEPKQSDTETSSESEDD